MSNLRRFPEVVVASAILVAASQGAAAGGDAGLPPDDFADFAPGLPVGPSFPSGVERPRDESRRPPACSFSQPVCVHAGGDIGAATVLGALADLERAAGALSAGVGLPRPLADGLLGGSSSFDLYLVAPAATSLAGASETTARDEAVPGSLDRSSAFALLRADAPAGCVRPHLVARALASAVQWGIDAGEDPAVRESIAAYLAELVAPCGAVTDGLVDDFQAHPERALSSPGEGGPSVGMALPWYLDVTLGSGAPGHLPIALAVLGAQRTPAPSFAWNNEPDVFDVLRGVLKAKTPPLALSDLWVEFALARLFMGARDDGVHFAESASLGSFGRVRFDWSVDYASLPRRLSPERPIDPTGSTYVWVDLRGAPRGARLALRMEWEVPVLFRWVLVRVRPDGSEASHVLVTSQQRSTSADRYLDDLDGLAGVAIIGINTGDLRLDDPFDPDVAPYEPHSYVLTVAAGAP
jgi:hypothetical protein